MKHGMKGTRFYRIWTGMKTRCLNKNHVWYKHYGGRGIVICDEWTEFKNFSKDMYNTYCQHSIIFGEMDTSIDRIDPNKGYNKENCKWATKKEQSNNARNNVKIEYDGETKTLYEWAEKTGINYQRLWQRIFKEGMPLEKALTTKIRNYKK